MITWWQGILIGLVNFTFFYWIFSWDLKKTKKFFRSYSKDDSDNEPTSF